MKQLKGNDRSRRVSTFAIAVLSSCSVAFGYYGICYCNEVSTACNSASIPLTGDQCINYPTGSDTIVQAMPAGVDRGYVGYKAVAGSFGTCFYRIGTLINGVCSNLGPTQPTSVASTEIDTQQGKCTQPCNGTPI